LETTGGEVAAYWAILPKPTQDERLAADRVMGKRSKGRDLKVSLQQLDEELRQRTGAGLADVVEAAVGPLRDLPSLRAQVALREEQMWKTVESHAAVACHGNLKKWFESLRATGRWRTLDDPPLRLRQALDVLERLPLPVPAGRSRLAAGVLGDSHALDSSKPVGRLVLAALAQISGEPPYAGTAGRRRLWSSAGVEDDETSSTVLTLGLRPAPKRPGGGPMVAPRCRYRWRPCR